jgi:hypothetical protein
MTSKPTRVENSWEVYRCPVTSLHFDPFRVFSLLHRESGNKLNQLAKDAEGSIDSRLVLVNVARKAFGLDPVMPATGQGYPDAVVLAVLGEFRRYVAGKGSGAGNWRTWSRPRESPPSSAPTTTSPSGSSAGR